MSPSQRQEVFNVLLAQLLKERGVIVAPETILYTGAQRTRQMPDVIVNFQGLRTAIEGEFEASDARDKAIRSAAHRVETGVAHIGVGVVYPASLREVDFAQLKDELARARLDIAVATESGNTGFVVGDIDDLERTLRSTFEQLIKEDVVAEAVALLDVAVDRFAAEVLPYKGDWGRITLALGAASSYKELETLPQEQAAANCRIGGLVLINAMIFHDILAHSYPHLTSLKNLLLQKRLGDLPDEWQYILKEINYYSIFHLATMVYVSLGSFKWGIAESLNLMAETAQKISEKRTALRHDLMGRVYHRLLADAKYLGTYYTSIPAATMLLKLALRPAGWPVEWHNVDKVGELRIADLACGTGTLLMAAADTLIDNYVSTAASQGLPVDLDALHRQIAQTILHGYDVLPAAIHLTASTLALRSPEVPFKKMNLFSLPHGGIDNRLGSLEFLGGNLVQFPLDFSGAIDGPARAQQVTGTDLGTVKYTSLPDLDLCVMNPPFVRSVGGNLLFGSVPDSGRAKMQTKLKKLVKKSGVSANITSGLGSVFVAIGDRSIKPGGRLALVLPKALLSGVAWNDTRQLVNRKYRLDYVMVSHDAERWNFSDSTDLSEVLLVATKNEGVQPPPDHRVVIVNLWKNPTTALEALAIVSQIESAAPPDLISGQGAAQVRLNGKKAGEVITFPWKKLQADWFLPCAFAQSDLTRSATQLIEGQVWLPGAAALTPVKTCPLGELGVIGPDRRDIHDAFEIGDAPTAYPSFWGHDAKAILTIAQEPNKYLAPLTQAKPNRSLRKVTDLWPLAGKILLAERMRLNTQRLVAVRLDQAVLSNVWWSFALNSETMPVNADKALVLWLNSTLGLLTLFATRDETQGAWVDFKKPSLHAMPVLDVRALSAEPLATLAAAYDRLCHSELQPLPRMAADDVRADIDRALAQALGLPDLAVLRTLMAREPVVCMKRIG